MTDFNALDFDVGQWGTVSRGPEKDLQDLVENISLVRRNFKSSLPLAEETVVRGMIWVNAATTTWVISISDGSDWIELMSIDTLTNEITYPGGFIASDSLPDGALNTYHVKDGELDDRTISNGALRGHHPSSGTLVRAHVASGAVRGTNLQTACLQSGHFASRCATSEKFDAYTLDKGTTGTSLDVSYYFLGVPDIKGGYIYGRKSCNLAVSQVVKTGFTLKSSTSTSLRVEGYIHVSQ